MSDNNKNEENIDMHSENDGRDVFDFKSKYKINARVEIWCEATYLIIILCISIFILFCTWKGGMYSFLDISNNQEATAKQYLYYLASGMLGGVTFGMKYFYRVVARGLWHQDRRVWRLLSPLISAVVALMVGILIDASILTTEQTVHGVRNGASIISIGFLAGYFADEAVGKMYEIANVIFGANKNK